ncbi:hypothetical protein JW848_06880 [Candidatus Bipolaricaulota bacterium]|nr:hypothetical protein [Candidatus Bipolaricaulota bacterium]
MTMTVRKLLGIVALGSLLLCVSSCSWFPFLQPADGMQEAIDLVTSSVLPDVVPQGTDYICLRLSDPLPPGTEVEEDAPLSPSGNGMSASPKALTVGEETYFFFLDLAPGTYYEHPVKYILVTEGGGHQVLDARWWPRINGEIPDEIADDTPDPRLVVAANVTLAETTGQLMQFDFDLVLRQLGEGFIVVQGLMPHENLFGDANSTYLNGIAFFNAYKSAFSEVEGLVQSQAANVLDEIDSMVAAKLNPITLYIIAHGGTDGIRLGGQWFTAQQFHDKMAEHPSTLFNFLLGSCHSGSFMDNLNTLDNVRVVLTACSTTQGATPDWDSSGGSSDYNPEDTGSEWTSSVLRAAELIVGSSDRWGDITSWASTYRVPVTSMLLYQAGLAALGNVSSLSMTTNYDLSNRVGHTTPQSYRSWLVLIPIYPILPLI